LSLFLPQTKEGNNYSLHSDTKTRAFRVNFYATPFISWMTAKIHRYSKKILNYNSKELKL